MIEELMVLGIIAVMVAIAALVILLKKISDHLSDIRSSTYYSSVFLNEIKQHVTRPQNEDILSEKPITEEPIYNPPVNLQYEKTDDTPRLKPIDYAVLRGKIDEKDGIYR